MLSVASCLDTPTSLTFGDFFGKGRRKTQHQIHCSCGQTAQQPALVHPAEYYVAATAKGSEPDPLSHSNHMMSFTVLSGLLCLLQVWPSSTQFVFEFELVSVTTVFDNDTCDSVLPEHVETLGACEPFLSTFCLREGTSTQNNDMGYCPLGRNDTGIIAYTPGIDLNVDLFNATRPGLPNGPVNRTITSQHPWPVRFYI